MDEENTNRRIITDSDIDEIAASFTDPNNIESIIDREMESFESSPLEDSSVREEVSEREDIHPFPAEFTQGINLTTEQMELYRANVETLEENQIPDIPSISSIISESLRGNSYSAITYGERILNYLNPVAERISELNNMDDETPENSQEDIYNELLRDEEVLEEINDLNDFAEEFAGNIEPELPAGIDENTDWVESFMESVTNDGSEDREEAPNEDKNDLTDDDTYEVINSLDSRSRFSGADWFESVSKLRIMLAGLGGIGSWTAFMLSRMGINRLMVYDFDNVEKVNLSGQLYSNKEVGLSKVQGIRNILYEFSEFQGISTMNEKYTKESMVAPIMVCGFDNMTARKIYFRNWNKLREKTEIEDRKKMLFIDGRLSLEEFQIFAFTGDDDYNVSRYMHEFLFGEGEAEQLVCNLKQTTFTANMIASYIANIIVNFAYNENSFIDRPIPFLTNYQSDFMLFKIEM